LYHGGLPLSPARTAASGTAEWRGVARDVRREYPSRMEEPQRTAAAFTPDSRLVLSRDQVSCDLAGDAAIVNLNNGVYYGLDAVGARVWNLMREPITFAQMVDTLLTIYDVDRPTLETDIRAFVHQLAAQGLVEITA
jgi:hypothetical protein